MAYETILYDVDGAIATITLNRPERLNTIVPPMPQELGDAVVAANADRAVKVIILRGAGRSFCAGFDFSNNFGHFDEMLTTNGKWDPGKDMSGVTNPFTGPVPNFMRMWDSPKPVIAQIHGWCVGGGSDMALCADLVIASEDAQIGTPYSRMWGCYLTGMWLYRLGLTKAKWHALTGEPLSGKEAAEVELINKAVPFDQLEREVRALADRLAQVPLSQLVAMKTIVNQAYANMGMRGTQLLGPILDGYMRNTPDADAFIDLAGSEGVRAVITKRDGPFGDYSQGPAARQPNPDNVITP